MATEPIRINQFFASPGARADRWQDLVECRASLVQRARRPAHVVEISHRQLGAEGAELPRAAPGDPLIVDDADDQHFLAFKQLGFGGRNRSRCPAGRRIDVARMHLCLSEVDASTKKCTIVSRHERLTFYQRDRPDAGEASALGRYQRLVFT